MATIKNTTSALGNLITQINGANQQQQSAMQQPFSQGFGPVASGPGNYNNANNNYNNGNNNASRAYGIDDDSIPANMLQPEPVFNMNYKSTRKMCIKKAKEQLMIIAREIIPTILQDSRAINDKISQDAETLGSLYYEYEKNDKMIQAIMEIVARGETSPRMFDVYQKMTAEQSKLSTNITETQNNMRKYYIDICMDIQQKATLDENLVEAQPQNILEEGKKPLELAAPQTNVMVGTEQAIKMINERKRQAMIAKYEEVKEDDEENDSKQ